MSEQVMDSGEELIAHLDAQIDSARSLLALVIEQGAAIRARDVHSVVRLAGILRGEMSRRELVEQERARLLRRSGDLLGIAPEAVTISSLRGTIGAQAADLADAKSAELSGLLRELRREHACNSALMHIELSFLDHLFKTLALDGAHAYDSQGSCAGSGRTSSHGAPRVLDLQA